MFEVPDEGEDGLVWLAGREPAQADGAIAMTEAPKADRTMKSRRLDEPVDCEALLSVGVIISLLR
ncbi:hypothetical protein [Brevundimonas sp. NIBR10]|uniref:hypothetical protein n=1 Tax=Brevundimonas sp. NIBR10 TaxID=3015997 RepID=UPI0022F19B61|nr:hypothetical protein [Brevundimonas sp. NIBR10]